MACSAFPPLADTDSLLLRLYRVCFESVSPDSQAVKCTHRCGSSGSGVLSMDTTAVPGTMGL